MDADWLTARNKRFCRSRSSGAMPSSPAKISRHETHCSFWGWLKTYAKLN